MRPPPRFEFYGAASSGPWAAWVAARVPGCARGWQNCAAMRVSRGAETIGCVIYHDWNPEAEVICLSAAGGDGWLTRPVIYAIHEYPFDQIGCQMTVLQTAEDNATMRRIALAYGYREYAIPRLRGRNAAEIILTLTDDDWRASRFHKGQFHGQTQRTEAA